MKKTPEPQNAPLIPGYPPWDLLYDPLGSYTGRTLDNGELPIQDADDL